MEIAFNSVVINNLTPEKIPNETLFERFKRKKGQRRTKGSPWVPSECVVGPEETGQHRGYRVLRISQALHFAIIEAS